MGKDKPLERLLKVTDELEIYKNNLQSWTDSLEELAEIQDALDTSKKTNLDKMNEEYRLEGKTILDVGTDCIKPLYIALKFKPAKIIGIDEQLVSYASDIKLKSKLLTETKIGFHDCSLFNDQTLQQVLRREEVGRFDLVLVSKTLHHLRTAKCIAKKRDKKHVCTEDEKDCIYGFEEEVIFQKLLALGERVVIYECFVPQEEDEDKIRGRGGYFTAEEWKRMFKYLLSEKYHVNFIRPQLFHLNGKMLNKKKWNNIASTLRKVDTLCFYVENPQ